MKLINLLSGFLNANWINNPTPQFYSPLDDRWFAFKHRTKCYRFSFQHERPQSFSLFIVYRNSTEVTRPTQPNHADSVIWCWGILFRTKSGIENRFKCVRRDDELRGLLKHPRRSFFITNNCNTPDLMLYRISFKNYSQNFYAELVSAKVICESDSVLAWN